MEMPYKCCISTSCCHRGHVSPCCPCPVILNTRVKYDLAPSPHLPPLLGLTQFRTLLYGHLHVLSFLCLANSMTFPLSEPLVKECIKAKPHKPDTPTLQGAICLWPNIFCIPSNVPAPTPGFCGLDHQAETCSADDMGNRPSLPLSKSDLGQIVWPFHPDTRFNFVFWCPFILIAFSFLHVSFMT